MWLPPCSSSTSSVRSSSALETSPSAAAPKITRLDSCPVAPKGARSIIPGRIVVHRARGQRRTTAGRVRAALHLSHAELMKRHAPGTVRRMGAIHVHEFMTLDGVVDAPTWTFEYGFDPKMGETLAAITERCSGILLGRRTYEMFE